MTRGRKMLIFGLVAIALCAFIWQQNNGIMTGRYEFKSESLPGGFDGYTIAHLSDLHNKSFGPGQRRLLKELEEAQPDLIVITGDIVDSRRYDLRPAVELVEGAVKIAPVYYVSGNHEARNGRYADTIAAIEEAGAEILEDRAVELARNGDSISLAGLADPAVHGGYIPEEARALVKEAAGGGFTLLLSHRPELIGLYAEMGVDLAFSGHAHGGQFRLPGVGGLFAPGQGFFPRYTAGVYAEGDASMVVSRGLGNSAFPLRLFNRPEIVIVELKK